MGLEYHIKIEKISEDEGGGWMASIPQLGKWAFCGDGKTVKEALQCLEHVKKNLFEDYLKEGVEIPEPEREILNREGL